MARTVKLKKYSDIIEEYVAAGTITPGMLVEFDSDGKVVAHSDEGEQAIPMFALENELLGKALADDYSSSDPVQVWIPGRGDQVYALLIGASVEAGDLLQSNGDGKLKKYVPTLANASLEYKESANGILITARQPGSAGNKIKVAFVDGTDTITKGSETVALATSDGVTTITVTYRSTATASTMQDVIDAIRGDEGADALVICEPIGDSDSTQTALTATALEGGSDVEPLSVVAQALEAKNPAAGTVRVAARVV